MWELSLNTFLVLCVIAVGMIYLTFAISANIRLNRDVRILASDKYKWVKVSFALYELYPNNIDVVENKKEADNFHLEIMRHAMNHIYKGASIQEIRQWKFSQEYKRLVLLDAKIDDKPLDLKKIFPKKD